MSKVLGFGQILCQVLSNGRLRMSENRVVRLFGPLQSSIAGINKEGISLLLATASIPTLGLAHLMQWVPGTLSPDGRLPGHEDDCSPPPSAKVKNAWSCISIPPNVFMVTADSFHRWKVAWA
jgi:hypothetical protein